MKFNNRIAIGLLSAGALIGTAGVVALQTHAQQAPSAAPQVQSQAAPATQTATPAPGDKVTPGDTDNIQDPGGVEQADAPDANEVKDAETNDDKAGTADTQDNGKNGQTNDDAGSTTTTK